MSYILSDIKQIRFPVEDSPYGWYQVVINRPGTTDLNIADADTLILSKVTDFSNGDFSPFIASDLPLSKKFTTTKGRRALNDVEIGVRDSYGYSGTVDGVDTSERFDADYLTFFGVFFDEEEPYKAFILWKDAITATTEDAQNGWIDPAYKPSADPNVTDPGTANQLWCGTQTVKITSLSQAQLEKTFGDVLATISSTDCQEGVPYNGYMFAPSGCAGKSNTRQTAFGGGPGGWYQAVPHIHKYSADNDPILVGLPAASWPSTPWVMLSNAIAWPGGIEVTAGGTGYHLNDVLSIDGGTNGLLKVILVSGPGSYIFELINSGTNYSVGSHTTSFYSGTPGGTGLLVNIKKVISGSKWGPSGFVFISVGTLFAKIAAVLGLSAFDPATDLKSALDFFAQKADNVALNFPIDPTPIPLDELYISLNVFGQSHPYNGSYWPNNVGFTPTTTVTDVLTGVCNFLLSDYNEIAASDGTSSLAITAMGADGIDLPAPDEETGLWVPKAVPSQEEPPTAPRIVLLKNRADDLEIQCPLGIIGDSVEVEVPIRLHRIGNTSGTNPVNDKECFIWDSNLKLEEQDRCFQVAWIDADGNPSVNPDCWKSLCFLYWFNASNTNVVYPSDWNPFPKSDGSAGSWANSFYVVNACYKSGATPSANLQAEVNGNDYFNSRDYHAVAFAALNLPLPVIQVFEYAGVADSTGSVQNIAAGIKGRWRYGANPIQDWRGIEVTQNLKVGTQIKWQAQPNTGAFPNLTDLAYGPINGGGTSTSTGGSNTGDGGVQIPVQQRWNIITPTQLTVDTDDWSIGQTGMTVAYISSDSDARTLSGITGGVAGSWLVLHNIGIHYITLRRDVASVAANRFLYPQPDDIQLAPEGAATFFHSGTRWKLFSLV